MRGVVTKFHAVIKLALYALKIAHFPPQRGFRKRSICLLLLLTGCTTPSPWHYRTLPTYVKEERSACMSLKPAHPLSEIGIELVRSSQGTFGWLLCLGGCGAPEPEVHLIGENQECVYPLHALEGGDRFLLPPPAAEAILRSLYEGHPLTLQVEGRSLSIDPHLCSYYVRRLVQLWPLAGG